jgi:hypothetical protein
MSDQGCLSRRTNRLPTTVERSKDPPSAGRMPLLANGYRARCGPRRHLPSALRDTGATRSGLAFQLPATSRTTTLVRVSPAETNHHERRRRNAADHVPRRSLRARLVQADAGSWPTISASPMLLSQSAAGGWRHRSGDVDSGLAWTPAALSRRRNGSRAFEQT